MDTLKADGHHLKFPAKSGCHQGRWCSGSLKAQVESKLYSDIDGLAQDVKILVISGERRQESAGRAKYNEMEIHRTNATAKAHRLVHQWRSVIDWDEAQVWDIIRRHQIAPHPCYAAGWNRCSYSTYTNCIYKVLFGIDAARLREKFGIKKSDNLRDCFSQEELRAVQSMECLVSGLVDCGWEYSRVKEFILQNNAQRQLIA